jgi:nitrogen regulatory protein P-II 2
MAETVEVAPPGSNWAKLEGAMKMIIAIIRPELLDATQQALAAVLDEQDFYRLTVDGVEGHGRQQGEDELVRGQVMHSRQVERVRLTICVNERFVDAAVDAIIKGARTDSVGDGKVFVVPMDDVVRIRTGERGGQAI